MFIDKGKVHIEWQSCGNEASGYGASNAAILRALGRSNIVVHGADGKCEVGVAYMPLDHEPIELLANPVKVLYTMFEATRWPENQVSAANCANEVWVPSKWCADTLRASGCNRPIRIINLGFDKDAYYPGKRLKHKAFTIGFAGAAVGRKGFDLLIKAFLEEFDATDNVRLLIRTSNYWQSDIPKDPRIQLIDGVLDLAGMRDFYLSCDLLVLPSRGEGFGLTALEAMACGTCVAVTDFGGSKEYLGDDTLRIACGMQSANGFQGCIDGYWASPSMQSLRYCLRWAYANPTEAKGMGRKAAKRVADTLTYDNTAVGISDALTELDVSERIDLTKERVVVWRGNPMKVNTSAGQFVRGIPRVLTDAEINLLNPADKHDKGFQVKFHYIRSAPTAD